MYIEVYLEYPEDMIGIIRLESVISYDNTGREIKNYQDLIDNTPFNNCGEDDVISIIKEHIFLKTGISQELIQIMN